MNDPLFAKAIVLRQGPTSVAVVISDLLSVPPDLSHAARRQASKRTGIPLANIVIAATHNHGAPEYWGSLRDVFHKAAIEKHGRDPHEMIEYQARLVAAWSDAIEMAWRECAPATIQFALAQQHGLAFNRRFHMRDGTVRFNPGVGNANIVRSAGPVDEDLPFLLFRRAGGERPAIASLTTFAMHTAVHSGTEFSGDFPAVLQSRLRQHFGREFISLFAEGTAGDLNHINVVGREQLRGRAEVERIGNTLADTVLRELPDVKRLQQPSLAVGQVTVSAPFQPVSEMRYRESMRLLLDQKTRHIPFMTLDEAWRDCHRFRYTARFDRQQKPLEVQAIRLDRDTAIVTLPHEVFVEIGLAIKAASPFRNTIVISLAGDVDYYIPTRRAFEEGSYEVTACPLDPGCGEQGWRMWIRAYLACVAFVDDQFGQLIDSLEQHGMSDNTIVVFTSDHGFHMGEKSLLTKKTCWEEATRVPMLIRVPGISATDSDCLHCVSLVDLYPTLVDLCGLPDQPNKNRNGVELDGHSLRSLLVDPKSKAWTGAEAALSCIEGGQAVKVGDVAPATRQHFTLRTGNWRYVLYADGDEELYDHRSDPQEWINLAGRSEHAQKQAELRSMLVSMNGTVNR